MKRQLTSMLSCVALMVLVTGHATTADNDADQDTDIPNWALCGRGTVMICGGGDPPRAVYDEFVRLAGGPAARLVLIPSASKYETAEDLWESQDDWQGYDIASLKILDTDDPDEADTDEFVAPLKQATGVWIDGGQQERLIHRYGGRKVEAELHRLLERGGIVGGTSAGAAVMSRTMIREGQAADVVVDRGFGLLPCAVVDSHFSQRGRHTRLLTVLESRPHLVGIGLDEETALVVQHQRLRVLGGSKVSVCLSRGQGQSVVIHRLGPGDEATLSWREGQDEKAPAEINLLRLPAASVAE